MRLTGKCKVDFEKWRISKKDSYLKHCFFEELMPSMQYGVYVDFFDSVGHRIGVSPVLENDFWVYVNDEEIKDVDFKTRPEARAEAIKKANEIYNLK